MNSNLLFFVAFSIMYWVQSLISAQGSDIQYYPNFFGEGEKMYFLLIGLSIFFFGMSFFKSLKNNFEKTRFLEFLQYSFFILLFLLSVKNILLNQGIFLGGYHFINSIQSQLIIFTFFIGFILLFAKSNRDVFRIKDEEYKYSFYALVVIFGVFLCFRFSIPLLYNGSYIDEYYHIFSGITFMENGRFDIFYNDSSGYKRWPYVSIGVGYLFSFFGKDILIAKILPILIGFLGSITLFSILKKLYLRKYFVYLTMLIYTISPFVIFNHFYVRGYVFYELFFLVSVFFYILIIDNFYKKNKLKLFFYVLVFIFFNVIIGSISNDSGVLLICLANFFFFCLSLFLLIPKIESKSKTYLYIKNLAPYKKFSLLIILVIIFEYLLGRELSGYASRFLSGETAYSSPSSHKYDNLFLNINAGFTILCVIGAIGSYYFYKSRVVGIISVILMGLIGIHFLSSSDFQLTRGILYIFPIFYVFSIIGYGYTLTDIKLTNILLLLVMIMSSFYPGYIKNGPYIKGEVSYREYKKVSDFLKNKCGGKKIYAPIHNPDRYYFYDIKVDRHSYIDSKMLTKDRRFYKDDQGVYRIVHENIPTMTSKESVYDYLNNNSSCILVEKSGLERYLGLELFDYINKNYYSKKIGITDVYYQ